MSQERRPLVAGNWKMHGTAASVKALMQGICQGLGEISGIDLMVCPPASYLQIAVQLAGKQVAVAGQNMAEYAEGAYTGEVSAEMLLDLGCSATLLGHSERRTLFGETSEAVGRKVARAVEAGITPVICIGETLEEREQGRTEAVLAAQLKAIDEEQVILPDMVLAYEPVWAIGTGKTATPEQAQEVHAFLREQVAILGGEETAEKLRILYGGSVKPDNASGLFGQADIDGGLIGGAALEADSFLAIARAAMQ